MSIIRPLTNVEYSFTYSNTVYPLCVVVVLKLTNGPDQGQLRFALDELQRRHLLLNSGIIITNKSLVFSKLDDSTKLNFEVRKRCSEEDWKTVAEEALNTIFPMEGPLMRCVYLPSGNGVIESELITVFHHSIMDGVSCRMMLHELLHLSGGGDPTELSDKNQSEELKSHQFPKQYQGAKLLMNLIPFMFKQMVEDISFRRKGISNPSPDNSKNSIINLQLSEKASRQLIVAAGQSGLTLNSVLSAAILLATYRVRYQVEKKSLMRVITFANMRPFLDPEVGEDTLGCFISMLRFNTMVRRDTKVKDLAESFYQQMFSAGRKGYPFLFSFMSKYLIKMAVSGKSGRLTNTALSYIGKLELNRFYGNMELNDLQAYITNNKFGPEFSGFGKILFGKIGLDFTFMKAEMDQSVAEQIVDEIKALLEGLV